MEYVLEVIEHSLRLLPLSLLRIFQGVSLVDKACLYKFAIDFKGVDDVNKRLYICTKGAYEYDFFNMCFFSVLFIEFLYSGKDSTLFLISGG